MKYIVYQDGEKEYMVVFPKAIFHNRMADAIQSLKFGEDHDWHRHQGEVVSAGFIDGGECHGRSESLNIASRKGIDTMLYRAGGSRQVTKGTPS